MTAQSPTPASASDEGEHGPYTGVVLIHGLGPIRRNGMLEQSLNALSYWFNHRAQLALRPEGLGRMWLAPELTDDPDPDQPESRATVELVAPDSPDGRSSGPAGVRLEIREVWWAESFGVPDIGATISWAQVQWREQAAHLLVPLGKFFGPAQTASRAPAQQTAQALTYRPRRRPTDGTPLMDAGLETPSTDGVQVSWSTRRVLRAALWLYDLYQYLWKGLQWLIVTPLLSLLLILMAIVRLLAVVPFLHSALIAGFKAISDNIMLHWVAEIRVYLTDYTRSFAICQRFKREIKDLLQDPNCDRIVVIGESGGTYIAYEGLTTVLRDPGLPRGADGQPKPVTFVSIATALRRIWLLAEDDAHRLHGVLPQYVKWIHFWARYDPVAAGPLTENSIPPITKWDEAGEPNPYEAIRETLRRCENVDVANTDSVFTDHTGYWDNQEQVVGPIALELVAGHPALERMVRDHLASPDEVLLRRWSIAWRYSLSFAVGVAAGVALLLWSSQNPGFGDAITSFLRQVNWGNVITSVCPPCQAFVGNSVTQLPANPTVGQVLGTQPITYLFTHYITIQILVVGVIILATMALANAVVGQLTARATPGSLPEPAQPAALHLGGLFAVSTAGIGMIFVASLIYSGYLHQFPNLEAILSNQQVLTYIWIFGIAEILWFVSYVATVVATLQQRQWAWLAGVSLSILLLSSFDPFYEVALTAATVGACILCLTGPYRPSGAAGKIVLVAIIIVSLDACIGEILDAYNILSTPLLGSGVYVEYFLPPLMYALWTGRHYPRNRASGTSAWQRIGFALAIGYMSLATLLMIPYVPAFTVKNPNPTYRFSVEPLRDFFASGGSFALTPRSFGVVVAVLLGIIMLFLAMAEALRQRQLAWFIGMPLYLVWLVVTMGILARIGVQATQPESGLLLSYALVAVALTYGLWVGPARAVSARKLAISQGARHGPAGGDVSLAPDRPLKQ